jgi:hypothetical protein
MAKGKDKKHSKKGRKGSLSKEEKKAEKAAEKRAEAAAKDDTDYNALVLENYDTQEKILDLTTKQIPAHSAEAVTDFIGKQLEMEKLLLSRNALEDTGMGMICNRLQGLASDKKLVNLKTWQLSDNNLTVEGAQIFGETLRLCESLTEVDASHNYLGPMPSNQMNPKGIKRIAQAIRRHPNLLTLDLTNVKLGDAGALLLCEHVKKNEKIEVINLARNQIGASGMQALLEVYTEHKSLATIDLADNALEDDTEALEALEAINKVCEVRTAEREARLAAEAAARAEAERLRLAAQRGAMLECMAMCDRLIMAAAKGASDALVRMHTVISPIVAAYYAALAAAAALPAAVSAMRRAVGSQKSLLAAVAPTQALQKGHKKPTSLRTWFGVQVDVPPGAKVEGVRVPKAKPRAGANGGASSDTNGGASSDTSGLAEFGFEVSLKQGKWQAGSKQGQISAGKAAMPSFGRVESEMDDGIDRAADSPLPPSAAPAVEGDASLTPLVRAMLPPLPYFNGHALTLVSTTADVDLRWGVLVDATTAQTPEQEREQELELEGLNALRLVLTEAATITMSHSLFLDPVLALAAKQEHLRSIGALIPHTPDMMDSMHGAIEGPPSADPLHEHGAFTVGMRAFPTLRQIAARYSERPVPPAGSGGGGFGVSEQKVRSLGEVPPLKTLALQSGVEVLVLRHVGCAEMGWQFRADVEQRHVVLFDGPWRQHRPASAGVVIVENYQQHQQRSVQQPVECGVMKETARETDDYGRLWVRVMMEGAPPPTTSPSSPTKAAKVPKKGTVSQALAGRGLYSSFSTGSDHLDADRAARTMGAVGKLKEWKGDTKAGLFQSLQRSQRVKELDSTFSTMMNTSSGTTAGNAALMALGDSTLGEGGVTDGGATVEEVLQGWVCATSMLVQAAVGNNGRVRGGARPGESEADQVRRQWEGWAWTVLPAEQWTIDASHFFIKVHSFEPVAVVQLHTTAHHKHSGPAMAPTSNQLASTAPALLRSQSSSTVHLPNMHGGSAGPPMPLSFPFRERLYVMPLVPPPLEGSIRIKVLVPSNAGTEVALTKRGKRRAQAGVEDMSDPLARSIAHERPSWASKKLEHDEEEEGHGSKAESDEEGEEGEGAAAAGNREGKLPGDTLVEILLVAQPIVVWVCPAKVDAALRVRQWGARQQPQPLSTSSNAYGKRKAKPGHETVHVGHGETIKIGVCGVSARRKWERGGFKRYEYDRLVVPLQLLREMLDRNDPLVIPGCVAAVTRDGFGAGCEDVVEALQVCLPLPEDVEEQLRSM